VNLDTLGQFSPIKPHGDGDFRPCVPQVFDGHGHEVVALGGEPWIGGLDPEVRQTTVVIDPVVEEPLQIALGLRLEQVLKIRRIFVLVRLVDRQSFLDCLLSEHVPHHPPDVGRLAAIELVDRGSD
jgi:hypothetical protein